MIYYPLLEEIDLNFFIIKKLQAKEVLILMKKLQTYISF